MANPKTPQKPADIGTGQGGAPDVLKETDVMEVGRPHRSRSERGKLIEDPNLNQSGNDRGSADQTKGGQTGAEIDSIPTLPETD